MSSATESLTGIAALERKSADEFSSWLYRGISGYYCYGEGRSAFIPAKDFVGISETLNLDIIGIYNQLSPDACVRFEIGCQMTVSGADITMRPGVIVVESLLRIASVIKSYRILEAFAARRGEWAAWRTSVKGIDLLVVACETAVELTRQGDVIALKVLRHFALEKSISPREAALILIGLCKAAPLALAKNVADLWDKLEGGYGYTDDEAEEEKRRRRRLALVLEIEPLVIDGTAWLESLVSSGGGTSQDKGGLQNWLIDNWWINTVAKIDPIRRKIYESRAVAPDEGSMMTFERELESETREQKAVRFARELAAIN